MNISFALQVIAASQGAFVLGVSIVILVHYLSLSPQQRYLQLHIMLVALSYNLLTVCTLISVFRYVYTTKDVWQILVMLGYLCGDIALVAMYLRISKKHKTKLIEKNS